MYNNVPAPSCLLLSVVGLTAVMPSMPILDYLGGSGSNPPPQ